MELHAIDELVFRLRPLSSESPQAPASRALEEERASLIGSLVFRPTILARKGVRYAVVRRWAHETRKSDLVAFKAAKAALDQTVIDRAGDEIAEIVLGLVGNWLGCVTAVAPGHSRRSDNFAVRIGWRVARVVKSDYVRAFCDRFVAGSSHPKQFANLPPLRFTWKRKPRRSVLVVDDLATSGFHMAEALSKLRAAGLSAMGVSWIGGDVRQ